MTWRDVTLEEACEHIRAAVLALEKFGVEIALGSGATPRVEDSFYIAFKCAACRQSYER